MMVLISLISKRITKPIKEFTMRTEALATDGRYSGGGLNGEAAAHLPAGTLLHRRVRPISRRYGGPGDYRYGYDYEPG